MKYISATRFAATMALALFAGGVMANSAEAGTGNWYNTSSGPTIYQTNLEYDSQFVGPTTTLPQSATIQSISWVINLSYYPAGTYAWINAANGQYYGPLPSVSGNASFPPNVSANQNFRFAFYISQSTTHTLSPSVIGGGHQLNVNYAY